MGSSNKTTHLNLNIWSGGDKPVRMDFVNDNNIIDNVVGSHIQNNEIHLSQADRKLLNSPSNITLYYGDGTESKTIELPNSCKFVYVFRVSEPPVKRTESGNLIINYGYSTYGYNATSALMFFSNSKLIVKNHSYENGDCINLNVKDACYIVVCVR